MLQMMYYARWIATGMIKGASAPSMSSSAGVSRGCQEGKTAQKPFPSNLNKHYYDSFELLHFELCGSMEQESLYIFFLLWTKPVNAWRVSVCGLIQTEKYYENVHTEDPNIVWKESQDHTAWCSSRIWHFLNFKRRWGYWAPDYRSIRSLH